MSFWTCETCTFAENPRGEPSCAICGNSPTDTSHTLIDGSKQVCPLCLKAFHVDVILVHAAACTGEGIDDLVEDERKSATAKGSSRSGSGSDSEQDDFEQYVAIPILPKPPAVQASSSSSSSTTIPAAPGQSSPKPRLTSSPSAVGSSSMSSARALAARADASTLPSSSSSLFVSTQPVAIETDDEDDLYMQTLMKPRSRHPTTTSTTTTTTATSSSTSSRLGVPADDAIQVLSQSPPHDRDHIIIDEDEPPARKRPAIDTDVYLLQDEEDERERAERERRRQKLDEIAVSDALLAETIARNEELEAKLAAKQAQAVSATLAAGMGAEFPRYWAGMGQAKFKLCEIYPTEEDIKVCRACESIISKPNAEECPTCNTETEPEMVINQFLRTFPSMTRGNIVSVSRVQHQKLWRNYQIFRRDMMEEHPHIDVNEKLLFHGAPVNIIQSIVKEGFDIRVANYSGALGVGTYFAVNASYSHSYSTKMGCNSVIEMLVCRVALGKSAGGSSGLRKPPAGCHSVINARGEGSSSANTLYAIFDNHQSYPEYLIRYSPTAHYKPLAVAPSTPAVASTPNSMLMRMAASVGVPFSYFSPSPAAPAIPPLPLPAGLPPIPGPPPRQTYKKRRSKHGRYDDDS